MFHWCVSFPVSMSMQANSDNSSWPNPRNVRQTSFPPMAHKPECTGQSSNHSSATVHRAHIAQEGWDPRTGSRKASGTESHHGAYTHTHTQCGRAQCHPVIVEDTWILLWNMRSTANIYDKHRNDMEETKASHKTDTLIMASSGNGGTQRQHKNTPTDCRWGMLQHGWKRWMWKNTQSECFRSSSGSCFAVWGAYKLAISFRLVLGNLVDNHNLLCGRTHPMKRVARACDEGKWIRRSVKTT